MACGVPHYDYISVRQGTGDDEDVEASSRDCIETEDGYQPVFFAPRPLKNLLLVDEMPSLMPITDMKVSHFELYSNCVLGAEVPVCVVSRGGCQMMCLIPSLI